MSDSQQGRPMLASAMVVLRWIVFIPLAAVAAWAAWIAVRFLNNVGIGFAGVDLESFMGRAYAETTASIAMGAAFVFAGAKVAPGYRKHVCYWLAGLGILLAGFALFPAVMVLDYWAIWSGLCVALGAGVVAYSVSTGETDLDV